MIRNNLYYQLTWPCWWRSPICDEVQLFWQWTNT